MKLNFGKYVELQIIRALGVFLVCLLAYIFGFVIAAVTAYLLYVPLLVTELVAPMPLAEFADSCIDQLRIYAKEITNPDLAVNSLLFGWGLIFVYALNRKMKAEMEEEDRKEALVQQAELNAEAELYEVLLTSQAPWRQDRQE
jgi:hypothetical protein